MSKTCKSIAMLMKRVASAKYLPGQTLSYPAVQETFRATGRHNPPSSVTERETTGIADVGIKFAIPEESFRHETFRVWVSLRVVQASPVKNRKRQLETTWTRLLTKCSE